MKVAKLYSFKDIRIEDMPIPKIGKGDALVRVKACGICSGDIMPWYIEKKAPLVLGHEAVGEIVKLGSSLVTPRPRSAKRGRRHSSFSVGDRIFFHHHAPCFKCRYCRNGDYVQCGTWRKSKIIPGGISEYALVPGINLKGDTLLLPDKISFEQATLIEPVACVVKALKRVKIRSGDTVFVIGLGVMGQLHIMLAKKYGASMVIGADRVPYRLKKAKDFGADKVIDVSRDKLVTGVSRATKGNMADVVVVGPGDVKAMSLGISCAGRGGRVLFFAPARPDDILKLQPNDIYFKDINIITSYSCGPDDTREALNLISEGAVDNRLITHRFPMAKTQEAFKLTAKAKNSLKAIVVI